MNRFLLADNPMHPEQSGAWVIHTLNPKSMIRCLEGHVVTDEPYRHYTYRNTDGVIEEWTLSAYHLFTTDFLTEPEEQVGKLLDRAWRWYRAYMEWEDTNIDTDESAIEN